MPCKDALIKDDIYTLTPDRNAGEVLSEMEKKHISFAPVVDEEKNLVGLFSLSRLLQDLLPVSIALGDTGSSVRIPAAPGMAKRLQKNKSVTVSELMDRQIFAVSPETPLEKAIRHVRSSGEPVPVVDEKSGAFLGVVTDRSLVAALEKMS